MNIKTKVKSITDKVKGIPEVKDKQWASNTTRYGKGGTYESTLQKYLDDIQDRIERHIEFHEFNHFLEIDDSNKEFVNDISDHFTSLGYQVIRVNNEVLTGVNCDVLIIDWH